MTNNLEQLLSLSELSRLTNKTYATVRAAIGAHARLAPDFRMTNGTYLFRAARLPEMKAVLMSQPTAALSNPYLNAVKLAFTPPTRNPVTL